jgi:phosphatidylglycerophosphatase A
MSETPSNLHAPLAVAPRRPGARFLFAHPAHAIALGLGSGLSPMAPGTVGTLWAWLAFVAFERWLEPWHWGGVLLAGFMVGWWACTVTARHLAVADPSSIVWDEVIAFWLVLWLVTPAGFWAQLVAFLLFRFFDAAKPGPVAWADALFKPQRDAMGAPVIGWRQGFGILLDDLVAALCTLLLIALWRAW